MTLPLLQTKFYVPPSRPQLVRRPLLDRLWDNPIRSLVLISAPAGFGKTTLVSEWLARTDLAATWLSLDDDDNDPIRFLTYLIAALQTRQPHVGVSAQGLLTAPQTPSLKAILTLLLNDLGTLTAPLALVLDDYHLIVTPTIHETLTFLIDHRPPTFHLIITSRIDPPLPLARWRVRNQLIEVRADDLRCTLQETASFLNDVMGLTLSLSEITALEKRTEGWIAGLQLAALSMQGRQDVAGFIQAFSGSHRHVLSYLSEEVLNRRPEGTLEFLLQTSLLERLSASLCDAVTGRSDSQQVLTKLVQANLFLIALDDEGKWYRYHHLFAEVLRTRLYELQPTLIPQLRQRATAWYEQQQLWSEGIHHALAAKDFAQAARLIERVGFAFFAQTDIQHSLQRWLATLPAEIIGNRPRLCLIYAWILFAHLDLPTAFQQLTAAEAALQLGAPQPAEASIGGEVAAIRAILTAYTPTLPAAAALVEGQRALALLSHHQPTFRAIAGLALGMAYMRQGDVTNAEQILAEATRMGQAADNVYLFGVAASHQVAMQRARGALRRALTTCQQTFAWAAQRGALVYPTYGGLYLNLADLLREQNDLVASLQYAEKAVSHSDQEVNPGLFIISRLALLRIRQAQGEWDQVWSLLQQVSTLAEQHPQVIHSTLLHAITAQLQATRATSAPKATDGLSAAMTWAQSAAWEEGALVSAYRFLDFIYRYEHSRIARAQIFITWARATGNHAYLAETLAYLERQRQIAEDGNLLWFQIKICLLQALAYALLGAADHAYKVLAQALELAQPEGFIRIFVDEGEPLRLLIDDFRFMINDAALLRYVDQLVAAFEAETPDQHEIRDNLLNEESVNPKPKIQNLIEPLSARELEVLQLVAAGLSNTEIAAKLIVSPSTVKTHINHIFGKLTVESRIQAVVRARELGLLPN